MLESFRFPSLIWCVLIGLYTAIDMSEIPERPSATALKWLFSLLVISITVAIANLSGTAIRVGLKQSHIATPATGLSLTFVKVVIWGDRWARAPRRPRYFDHTRTDRVGGRRPGRRSGPTGYALELFCGHPSADRTTDPRRRFHQIGIRAGRDVEDVSWRTTRIRMPSNDMVILPNSKSTQSVLVNYHLPDPRRGISIGVSVPHHADPDMIERMLLDETLKAVGTVPGLLAEPAPSVRFIPGFGESSLDFSVNCHVGEFNDHGLVQHELRKRILKRMKLEKIDIPFLNGPFTYVRSRICLPRNNKFHACAETSCPRRDNMRPFSPGQTNQAASKACLLSTRIGPLIAYIPSALFIRARESITDFVPETFKTSS